MEAGSVSSSALLVVDMQHDFIDGALVVPGAHDIIDRVNYWIEVFEDLERPIIYSMDWHPRETPHFGPDAWPVHGVAGTDGAQIHEDVLFDPARMPWSYVVQKGLGTDPGYSVCSRPSEITGIKRIEGYGPKVQQNIASMETVLAHTAVEIVYVVGVATDYCVLASVLDLLKLGMDVIVILDAVSGVNRESTEEALEEMASHGARFLLGDEIVSSGVDTRLAV